MDRLPLPLASPAAASSGGGRVLDAYKTALATAASAAAYAVLARSMARELLPDELRAAVRWCAAAVRARLGRGDRERHTIVIRRQYDTGYGENHLFDAARAYLATRIDPRAMRRLCLARSRTKEPDGAGRWNTLLCMEPGGSTVDVFDGVEFTWASVETGGDDKKKSKGGGGGGGGRASPWSSASTPSTPTRRWSGTCPSSCPRRSSCSCGTARSGSS
ncbi:hypothetical protein U9M48_015384 [Paspalum notatum var. saurae]|uniref:AAA-type ATPase N-terminal domain-containing protein n=1 Tax=Paspalum notatum var. saurae TaxID=547442 RepID=A0AAQ3T4R8_PASNO